MNLEDKCVWEGGKGCKRCDGYDNSCKEYLPDFYGDIYDATRIDSIMETYQKTKRVIKNGAGSLLRLWKKP